MDLFTRASAKSVIALSGGKGRLAFVLGKRLDFHPSGVILDLPGVKGNPPKVMLLQVVFLFPALFRGRQLLPTGFTVTACELLSRWQDFRDSNYPKGRKVMPCVPFPEVISPDC